MMLNHLKINLGGLKDFDPQLKAGDIGVFFLINKNNTLTTVIGIISNAYKNTNKSK